jgi:hypothetical protein
LAQGKKARRYNDFDTVVDGVEQRWTPTKSRLADAEIGGPGPKTLA